MHLVLDEMPFVGEIQATGPDKGIAFLFDLCVRVLRFELLPHFSGTLGEDDVSDDVSGELSSVLDLVHLFPVLFQLFSVVFDEDFVVGRGFIAFTGGGDGNDGITTELSSSSSAGFFTVVVPSSFWC